MKHSPQSNLFTKKMLIVGVAILLILLSLFAVFRFKAPVETLESPALVMRIDDIQDFAFRDAQIFLLEESLRNQVPLSLAIITGMFGDDSQVVQTVKLAAGRGSEVTVHGWEHEDLAKLSLTEQTALLSRSRSRVKEIFGTDVKVLVPPMFSFNQDTIAAMLQEGYSIISTSTEYGEPGSMLNATNIPATVELSDFSNGVWSPKSFNSVKLEISNSINKYGFAVIVTHPQEFISDKKLSPNTAELYRALLKDLKEDYSFKTLEKLAENWHQ